MTDFEVHIDLDGRTRPVGLARSNRVRGTETILFEYDQAWLEASDRFSLEPALGLTRGAFAPPAGRATFGSLGDSAPDTWGRRLMQRAERRLAEREGRAVRTLSESDYLLRVADETRLGALRFRRVGEETFQAPTRAGVPALIELGRLLQITERILRDEETDEDLQLIFAPGSSLGGARPTNPSATHRPACTERIVSRSSLRSIPFSMNQTLAFSEHTPNALRDGVWADRHRALAATYERNPISRIPWRGGTKIPLGQAPALYGGLSETPFVSLYAAAAFSEDIAETVTWQQLSERLGLELRIEVKDRDGKVIYSLDPIKSLLFRARFPAVEALLASEPGALAFDARRANRHSPYL